MAKKINHSFSHLSPLDQYLTICRFNERKKEYPTGILVHELFESQVKKTPKAIAVTYLNAKITYQKLNDISNQLAHYLIKKKVKRDSLVGISIDRSIGMIISILAVLKAGAAYLPIETSLPQGLIEFMINDSSTNIVITSNKYVEKFEKTKINLIKLDGEYDLISRQSTSKPNVNTKEANIAYAIYTSGSTGKRKAALIEHRSIVNQCFAWQDAYKLNEHDTVLQTASFSFDVFTGDWTRTLASGAKLVINPYNLILCPNDSETGKEIYDLMKINKITVAEFTPPVLRKLIRYAKDAKKSLDFMRLIIIGADAWYINEHKDLINFTKRKSRIVNSYGMTEATDDSTYYEEYGEEDNTKNLSLIGKPFINTEIYIMDDNNNVVSVRNKGELCIAGPGISRGYLNRPDLNAERFGKIIFPDGSTKRIYRSGDLARFKHDGNLELFGRKDSQTKLGGIRIDIGEIEAAVQKHTAIQENSVVIIEDENHNKKVACFAVANNKRETISSELKKYLIDKLPNYMIPSRFYIINRMPLTSNGKIDRKKLVSLAKSMVPSIA
jgi:amino acid adenylation domain-containing protein